VNQHEIEATGGGATSKFSEIAGCIWYYLCRAALCLGLATLVFIVGLIIFFDKAADYAAEQLLANAKAPFDRELPPTAHAISYASADIQPIGGQGDLLSCSVPSILEWLTFPRRGSLAPISLRMRQSCAFHDYCYRHGAATYGYSQADCDYLLLEHAYRICRFINTDASVARCVGDARKVLLGVRLGGRENFKHADRVTLPPSEAKATPCSTDIKFPVPRVDAGLVDDSCTSSYFEFNPYPIRAQAYTVYRIADVAKSAVGMMQKALYAFEIRPSGTRISIVGWTKEASEARCAGYELPGQIDFLNLAPLVVKSGEMNGLSEDWFVWWRRFNLDKTGGHLVVVAPARATLSDWAAVFPGAKEFHPSGCKHLEGKVSELNAFVPASNSFLIGVHDRSPDDANFSELHPAPGLESPSGIRLMTLRTHTCSDLERSVPGRKKDEFVPRGINILCHHDLIVDPAGPYRQRQEPYVVRDQINRWHEKVPAKDQGDGFDADRYRNFVTPPIPLAGPDRNSPPLLAWLRRGESRGETYETSALLRRAYHKDKFGAGLPIVRLVDFEEWADPTFVLGRTAPQPRLVVLREDRHGRAATLKMYHWVLPDKDHRKTIGKDCTRAFWDQKRLLNDCAESAIPRLQIAEKCTQQLDRTWLVRPPVVLPSRRADADGDIVFMRVVASTKGPVSRDKFVLEVKLVTVMPDGQCSIVPHDPLALSAAMDECRLQDNSSAPPGERGRQARNTQEKAGEILTALRMRPILFASLDTADRHVVIPNAKCAAKSLVHTLP
jgi:hypothetical protein